MERHSIRCVNFLLPTGEEICGWRKAWGIPVGNKRVVWGMHECSAAEEREACERDTEGAGGLLTPGCAN